MAKWGEGDPRWIVEERADATNVNNWHWTEKNATAWSRDKLKTLLEGKIVEDDQYACEITELTKCEGEASANNRKAKLIFFYEWELKAEWKGKLKSGDEDYKGTLEIPNLSEENEPEDIEVSVSVNDEKEDVAYKLKEFMRIKGAEEIRKELAKYITDLKKEFSQGMILPTKDGKVNKTVKKSETNKMKIEVNKVVTSNSNDKKLGVKIECKKLTETEEFMCEAKDLYRVLTEKEMVAAFTRGPVEFTAEVGGRFVLFGGNVTGEFLKMEIYEKLELHWRFKSWPDAHYSHVTLEFEQKDISTVLKLTQTGIPEYDLEKTKEGWKRYYWEPIKQTFGYGARLY